MDVPYCTLPPHHHPLVHHMYLFSSVRIWKWLSIAWKRIDTFAKMHSKLLPSIKCDNSICDLYSVVNCCFPMRAVCVSELTHANDISHKTCKRFRKVHSATVFIIIVSYFCCCHSFSHISSGVHTDTHTYTHRYTFVSHCTLQNDIQIHTADVSFVFFVYVCCV